MKKYIIFISAMIVLQGLYAQSEDDRVAQSTRSVQDNNRVNPAIKTQHKMSKHLLAMKKESDATRNTEGETAPPQTVSNKQKLSSHLRSMKPVEPASNRKKTLKEVPVSEKPNNSKERDQSLSPNTRTRPMSDYLPAQDENSRGQNVQHSETINEDRVRTRPMSDYFPESTGGSNNSRQLNSSQKLKSNVSKRTRPMSDYIPKSADGKSQQRKE